MDIQAFNKNVDLSTIVLANHSKFYKSKYFPKQFMDKFNITDVEDYEIRYDYDEETTKSEVYAKGILNKEMTDFFKNIVYIILIVLDI